MKQWKADTMSQRERSRNHGPDTKVAFRQSYGMLRQQINWYFQLKDDVLAREFAAFNQEQHSRGFLLYCLMIYTLLLPITFIIMIQDFTRKTPQSDAILSLSIIHTLSAVLTVVSGWRLYFNHCKHADDQIPELDMNSSDTSDVTVDYTQHYCGGWIDYACNPIFNIASQFLLTGIFIRRAFAEKCNEGSYRFLGIFDCNESKEDPGSFLSVAIIIMFISVLNFANIPDTRIEVAWFNLFVTFSIFLVTAVVKHVEGTLLLAIILLLSVAFTIVDIQIRNILIFLTNRKLTELLEENAKMADELHASEMRHMIGNVAHDLKTPLASFTTAIDIIQFTIDCSKKIEENAAASMVDFKETMKSIQSCTTGIKNTTAFMMMTINRCIDYTKATNGMRLVPKHETINLMDVLYMPLDCMRNIQQRTNITLLELPKDICSHVITDSQWLQENILCLLSNAVKYSTDGEVTIGVNLEQSTSNSFEKLLAESYHKDKYQHLTETTAKRNSEKPTTSSLENLHDFPTRNYNLESNLDQRYPSSYTFASNTTHCQVSPKAKIFLRFEIEDQGIGLSEDDMKQLFQPFKQAQRLTGGTGLGLYSLAKRVEALQGYYGVRCRQDGEKGCLFWFMIPYQPDEVTADIVKVFASAVCKSTSRSTDDSHDSYRDRSIQLSLYPSRSPRHSDMKKTIQNLHIGPPCSDELLSMKLKFLIVDDSPSILKMMAMMLKKLGHQITTAENGAMALHTIQDSMNSEEDNGFDVILMDLQMPIMDGLESTKRIREFERIDENSAVKDGSDIVEEARSCFRHNLIIGMSANSDDETIRLAYQAGMDSFIPKPFKIDIFMDLLRKCLYQRA